MQFRFDVLKFAMPVALLALVPACSGGGATTIPTMSDGTSSAARATLSGGSGSGGTGGGGGGATPAPTSSFRVTARIESELAYNPSGYYAVSYTYVIGGATYYEYGTPKIDVANGPVDVGACVTVSGTVIGGVNYFTKIVTELQSLCG